MGTLNPKPRDLDKAAVIMNGDEMRLRRADEQTEASSACLQRALSILIVLSGLIIGCQHRHSVISVLCRLSKLQ